MNIVERYDANKDRTFFYNLCRPVDVVQMVARERYAWPGGYVLCGLTADGALLCSQCIRSEYRNVLHSTKHGMRDGWQIISWEADCNFDHDSDDIDNPNSICGTRCAHCDTPLGAGADPDAPVR